MCIYKDSSPDYLCANSVLGMLIMMGRLVIFLDLPYGIIFENKGCLKLTELKFTVVEYPLS